MPITAVEERLETLTMTITADFDVSVRRLWDAYADPRQLEKFWGPPGWPATFTRHDFMPGGRSDYYMTGPDGEKAYGYWQFTAMDPPRSFEVRDGFRTADGSTDTGLPSIDMVISFAETPTGSRLVVTSHFHTAEELQQLTEMGMEEGMRAAVSQIDDVVADRISYAAGRPVESTIVSDTQVRINRIIRGSPAQVWQAHQEPELMRRWMLGPEGWRMPVCEVAAQVGDTYRFEWEDEAGGNRFGFTGELVESQPPHREVTTERMIGTEGPSSINEMSLRPVEGGTLLTLYITYPDSRTRDNMLATGMTEGMEASYARLESLLAEA